MSGLMPPNILSYEGLVATPFINRNFPPTTAFYNFNVPTIWIDPSAHNAYVLVAKPQNVADWIRIGGNPPDIMSLTGDTGGAVFADSSANIFTLGTSNEITVTGNPGSHTLTWSLTNGVPASSFNVDAHTAPGTDPVLPTSGGQVTITGGQVAAGTTTNVIRTDSLAANTYTIEVQRSQAVASSTIGDNGVCHFDSSLFTVDANGFVSMTGGANYISLSPFIVGTDAHSGYATIALGIAAAAAATLPQNVYIKPKVDGTAYTENVTLPAGVNLIAFGGQVILNGTLTMSSAGTSYVQGMTLQTNSANAIVVSGSVASVLYVQNCNLNFSNNTGISYTSSSSSSMLYLSNCIGDIGTSGITIFSMSSSGLLRLKKCDFTNTGSSSTASTVSAGTFEMFSCQIASPITTSGTANYSSSHSRITTLATNSTSLTIGGSGTASSSMDRFLSGTATCVSTSTSIVLDHADLNTSNSTAAGGAGTITLSECSIINGSGLVAPTTLTPAYQQYGITRSTTQPAFLAYVNTTITNVTGDGTVYTVIFDTEVYDQNNDFNLGTSTFTAPVTGKYHFEFGILVTGGTTITAGNAIINTTARPYNRSVAANIGGTAQCNGLVSVLANMTAGDTATFTINTTDSGGKIDDISGVTGSDVRTWVSGYLVC